MARRFRLLVVPGEGWDGDAVAVGNAGRGGEGEEGVRAGRKEGEKEEGKEGR